MTESLILWVFMLLIQQQGMAGGAGADKFACQVARTNMIRDLSEVGQQIIAASECVPFTLAPYKPERP